MEVRGLCTNRSKPLALVGCYELSRLFSEIARAKSSSVVSIPLTGSMGKREGGIVAMLAEMALPDEATIVPFSHDPCILTPDVALSYWTTSEIVSALAARGYCVAGLHFGSKGVSKIGDTGDPRVDSIYYDACDIHRSVVKGERRALKDIYVAPSFSPDEMTSDGIYLSSVTLEERGLYALRRSWKAPFDLDAVHFHSKVMQSTRELVASTLCN